MSEHAALACAIHELAAAIHGHNELFSHHHESHPATKHDLETSTNKIMSAISDFAAKLSAFQDRQDTAISDLQADVDNLTKQIAALQATQGAITPEDQALLDGIQARAAAVSDKLDALDALTPPTVPETTPVAGQVERKAPPQ